MAVFDFVSGDDFRSSLESDYAELARCFDIEAWKAVYVLAGSIIEAILIDYLLTIDYKKKSGKNPLTMTLDTAISACQAEGILSEKTAQLSHVLKSYRNLIHPGRKQRLNEDIDSSGAKIATALVDLIIKSITVIREKTLGYTAEQLTAKLLHDPSALAIFEDLAKTSSHNEIERFLLRLLPDAYFDLSSSENYSQFDDETLETLCAGFHMVFDLAPLETKQNVMKKLVSIVKEESQAKVFAHETRFFRAPYLSFLEVKDRDLIKKHLLARLKAYAVTPVFLASLDGFMAFISADEASALIDPILATAFKSSNEESSEAAINYLESEPFIASEEVVAGSSPNISVNSLQHS